MPKNLTFSRLLKAQKVLAYVNLHPDCTIPQIKTHLGVKATKPPNYKEALIYRIVNSLHQKGFLEKRKIKQGLSGPGYVLRITDQGVSQLLMPKAEGRTRSLTAEQIQAKLEEFSDEVNVILQECIQEILEEIKENKSLSKPMIEHTIQNSVGQIVRPVKSLLEAI